MSSAKRPRRKTRRIRIVKSTPDPKWIRARKALLEQLKSEVMQRLGEEPVDVREYAFRYEQEFKRRWTVSSKSELLSDIESSQIVYGGDFHALGQAQRTHLKILRSVSASRSVIIALECFDIRAQKWLDQFSQGKMTAEELKQRSNWSKTWGFPFEHYRPLMELARKRGYSLMALNTAATRKGRSREQLEAREKAAGKILRNACDKHPESLIYVLFGDLHLAESHLPRQTDGLFRQVIVHLNSERIYFQLARKGLELDVDVVKLKRGQYCVLSTPPWVKWQSYLLYLEQSADKELEDESDDGDGFDPTDHVAKFIGWAARDLGLEMKVDDLSVYSIEDEQAWSVLERKISSFKEKEVARGLLTSGRSFILPKAGIAFLSSATVNQAAVVAGQYIHAKLSGRRRQLWRQPVDFRALIWVEAVAFFISKLINHKRQSETIVDLRAQLERAGTSSKEARFEALRIALDQSMSELIFLRTGRHRKLKLRPGRRSSYIEAARILGGMLGERLYLAYRSRTLVEGQIVELLKYEVSAREFPVEYENILSLISEAFDHATGALEGREAFEGIKSRKERL